ncbi:MAG TPA: DUF1343 domain-containing protein [Thermomicrobiales bacterium]|nr:DUF1343 domain-containing protein [Thermomicrobiales bacterium]
MTETKTRPTLSGLDVVVADGGGWQLAGRRIGLITNQTGVDRHLRSVVDLLHDTDGIELVALFGPEHGVRGEAQAGAKVGRAVDPRTGVPVYSLYGETDRPTPDMLTGLDALVFDIQDVGVRYATYISTMSLAQEAAAAAGLGFVILDRPNPISGDHVEGNLLDRAFMSFVGIHPIPIRHGMTAGELARLFAAERGWPEPEVVPMQGWSRARWFDETRLPWVQPSPNLPTLDSVTLYPGTCLIEGTNISEGRGTTRPFELIGAPWLDPFALVEELERRLLPGITFRPAYFTPTFSKHANVRCGGVQVHIVNREALRPVELGLHLLDAVRRLSGVAFAWRARSEGGYFIDLLLGSDRPRQDLDAGAEVSEVTAGWAGQAEAFVERRQAMLLYSQ